MTGRATHEAGTPAIAVEGLAVGYGERLAISEVSFEVDEGEHLAVAGPNGAGKSTLLKAIAGLLPLQRGRIRIFGHPPRGHICIAYVPQRSEVDWRFPVTVSDVVMMGRTGRLGALRRSGPSDRKLVMSALDRVSLLPLADRQIGELSGGQQQRMFIARALAQEAEIILMDEPFAGLDPKAKNGVISTIEGLEGVTVLVALHDLGIATSHFDRILLLNGALLGIGPPTAVLTPPVLQRAYGSCLRMVKTDEGVLVVQDTACSGGET